MDEIAILTCIAEQLSEKGLQVSLKTPYGSRPYVHCIRDKNSKRIAEFDITFDNGSINCCVHTPNAAVNRFTQQEIKTFDLGNPKIFNLIHDYTMLKKWKTRN